MKLFNFYKSKKYLRRIMISVSTFILLAVSLVSYIGYFYAQDIILGIQNDANKKVLSQINYNVDYMNDVVRNIAMSLYFDNDIIPLMTASYPDQVDLLTRRMKIDKFADYTSFVDSIIVYNGQMDRFIWGGNAELQNAGDIRYGNLRSILEGERKVAKMRFFPLIPNVFSIANYDGDSYKPGSSALFVNIKTQWLFDNIRVINDLAGHINESIVILDESGRILNPAGEGAENADIAGIVGKLPANKETSGYYEYGSGKDKKLVSYMNIEDNGWKIVSVVPLRTLTGKVERLRNVSIIVTSVCLLASVIAALWISHRLYKPVGKLFNAFKPLPAEEGEAGPKRGDELAYISTVYHRALEQASIAQKDRISTRNIARQFYLRKLINESHALSEERIGELIRENGFDIDPRGTHILGIIKLDKTNDGTRQDKNKSLLYFAISNITQEIVSSKNKCETVDMRHDHLAMLISLRGPEEEAYRELIAGLQQAQDVVLRLYGVTFSSAFGDAVTETDGISHSYNETLQSIRYKYIFGPGAVIVPDMIGANNGNHETNLQAEWEKRLTESIKLNQSDAFHRTLDRIFKHVASLHHDYFEYMMVHVLLLMKNALKEINTNRIQPITVDLSDANGKILDSETLEGSKKIFVSIFEEIGDKLTHQDIDRRNEILMETIREIIETKFTDVNLGLQEIAEVMRMSPTYIGKIFKKGYGISVAEFINDIRLRYAVQYLEENKYTINEIIDKVGFSNRSIFFRLFKNKFGTTPKEYRINKSIADL